MRTIRNIFTTTPLREAISKATRLSHTPRSRTNLGVLLLGALTLPLATLGYAQETGGGGAGVDQIEEVVVTGTRQTIQDSISLKRGSTQIVDGLSADEIGDIPALSIGEALETVTGASSHRENGGATEVSIRGLGPFLTSTVLNGREATNGAGNRAVNFSIFPSELFNKIGIFKTQSASFTEGAVGGQIALDTKKPIDHGKRSIQLNLKGAYNENEQDIAGGQDIGYRGTVSYIDQFETDNAGTFGISLGVQVRDESNPEQEYRTSTTPRICDLDGGIPTGTTCSDDQLFLRDPATPADEREFAFLTSSGTFRQNVTDDERNSFFGALQWQPNDDLDINLDVQWSERIQSEARSDLVFAELNRNINNQFSVVSNTGVLEEFISTGQEIQLLSQDFVRDEEYKGIGLNVEYQVDENLTVSFDASYSNTFRLETEESVRLANELEANIAADLTNAVPTFTVSNFDNGLGFDPNQLGTFLSVGGDGTFTAENLELALSNSHVNDAGISGDSDADDRLRLRDQNDIRENTITALRGDFELQTENLGFVTSIEGGVRYSQLEYERRGNVNAEFTLNNLDNYGEVAAAIANNCVGDFPESGFLSEELNGRPLVVGVDVETDDLSDFIQNPDPAVARTEFNSFLSVDSGCVLDIVRSQGLDDGEAVVIEGTTEFTSASVDVEESTFAIYLQANYESELFGFPARGNFGARLIRTTVDSTTFNAPFRLDFNDNGSFELDTRVTGGLTEIDNSFSYTEFLPSATLVLDLSDEVLFRAGIFRGISRSDPAILGTRQQLGTVQQDILDRTEADNGDILGLTAQDLQIFISSQGVSGGSAELEPFTSWNIDLALEWYPNEDTILAAGAYYKSFTGGYRNTFIDSTFTVVSDGSTDTRDALNASGLFPLDGSIEVTAPISGLETTDDNSNLYGIELTASHAFSYLSGFWSGFGAKLSYNYADSDFEFEDDFSGAGVGVNGPLIGLTPPAEIFGLSRDVVSAQLYWSGSAFDAQVIFKHRSQYFQQFIDTPGRIRFVDDNSVVELRASYRVTDNIKLTFEALNITDEPRTDFRGVEGNIHQVLSYGPRYFFGVQAKF